MEEWRAVVIEKNGIVYDYTGLYEVCNIDGKVRNTKTGRILKPIKNKHGYCVVSLYKDGQAQRLSVHRIVAEVFIPNSENKPYVNHINEDKTDNRVENLEWCTASENALHGTCQQRRGEAYKGYKHTEETKRKISKACKGKKKKKKKN